MNWISHFATSIHLHKIVSVCMVHIELVKISNKKCAGNPRNYVYQFTESLVDHRAMKWIGRVGRLIEVNLINSKEGYRWLHNCRDYHRPQGRDTSHNERPAFCANTGTPSKFFVTFSINWRKMDVSTYRFGLCLFARCNFKLEFYASGEKRNPHWSSFNKL